MPPSPADYDTFGDNTPFSNHVFPGGVDIVMPPFLDAKNCCVADGTGESEPSSGRRSALAALAVEACTTSARSMPRQRNFDIVVVWSKAGPLIDIACASDEIVSGLKPLANIARAVLKAKEPIP